MVPQQAFRLPQETRVGHVHLRVKELKAALGFYEDLLGFRQAATRDGTLALSPTGQWPYLVLLTELPGAQPQPPGTTGLYHVAIRYPTRKALARTFQRLIAAKWPFQGFADHLVSEALYLADPDGNGLELYVDRPRALWKRQGGQIEMGTEPLDVENLLQEAAQGAEPWTGADPRTEVGHVHLKVSNLERAEAFYHGLLGLDVTQRGYPGALFLSAGGYHHHIAVNVWSSRNGPAPPLDSVGLVSLALNLPGEGVRDALQTRLAAAGIGLGASPEYPSGKSVLVQDPDGNGIELVVVP
jgi:catechol 2,3-dioxygenase